MASVALRSAAANSPGGVGRATALAAKEPPVVSVANDELVPTTRTRIVTSPRW